MSSEIADWAPRRFPVASVIFRALHGDSAKVSALDRYAGYLRSRGSRIRRASTSRRLPVMAASASARWAMRSASRLPPRWTTMRGLAARRDRRRRGRSLHRPHLRAGTLFAPPRKSVELAREMQRHGALYASHMRNEAAGLLDSVRETIRIGEEAGVAVQISHHKASGKENWGMVRESLRPDRGGARARNRRYRRSVSVYVRKYRAGRGDPERRLDEAVAHGGIGKVPPEILSLRSRRIRIGKAAPRRIARRWTSAPSKPRARSSARSPAPSWLSSLMNEDDVRTVMRIRAL